MAVLLSKLIPQNQTNFKKNLTACCSLKTSDALIRLIKYNARFKLLSSCIILGFIYLLFAEVYPLCSAQTQKQHLSKQIFFYDPYKQK